MGEYGSAYYARCGYRSSSIYPFMYQCEDAGVSSNDTAQNPVRLVYVGGFAPRKGVDLLLNALKHLADRDWRLSIVGAGIEEPQLRYCASELGISQRIRWYGEVPSSQIAGIMADHDICVVPSRFDGWGMAVNEAIEAGLAVVCTPLVCSGVLLEASGAGRVAADTSETALATAMAELIEDPAEIANAKRASRKLRPFLRGENVAAYLARVIAHALHAEGPDPSPPWTLSDQ